VDRGYWHSLSPPSRRSLEAQGGIFTAGEAKSFLQQPFARSAVRLRRWDDLARVPAAPAPDLGEIALVLRTAAQDLS
jgi:predicted HD phosphohydrolase